MIDIVVQHQALIREWINGSAMILFFTLTCMVGVFMWDTAVEYAQRKYFDMSLPRETRAGRSWQHAPGVPTACALWWVFLAETYRTGAVWTLYQYGKNAKDASVFFDSGAYFSSYGYLLAGIGLNFGLLRAIYIFTPPDWKRRVWVYAAIAANVFIALPTIYSNLRIIIDGF